MITIDGKPKQHLSQDVVPQAPIAKSAFKIKKAKLLLSEYNLTFLFF